MLARAGADIDDVIGGFDGLLVVLDHDYRVAEVAQLEQGVDQAAVVALVQADAGLVEDVEHAHQPAADLGRQSDPLGLAARERGRRAVQGEVVQPDVQQELEPRADFLDDLLADDRLAAA